MTIKEALVGIRPHHRRQETVRRHELVERAEQALRLRSAPGPLGVSRTSSLARMLLGTVSTVVCGTSTAPALEQANASESCAASMATNSIRRMIASLLPGLRDLRTPLLTGYAWLLCGWLLASEVPALKEYAHALQLTLQPLISLGGRNIGLAGLSLIAYFLGGVATRPSGHLPKEDGKIRMLLVVIPLAVLRLLGAKFVALRGGKLKVLGQFKAYALHSKYIHASDAERVIHWMSTRRYSLTGTLDVDESKEMAKLNASSFPTTIGDPMNAFNRFIYQYDPTALGLRLQIQSKDIWDRFDRTSAEAELRMAPTLPLLISSVLIGLKTNSVIIFASLSLFCIALHSLGIRRVKDAHGVLIQGITSGLLVDPLLDAARTAVAEQEKRENEARYGSKPTVGT